MHDYMFEIKLCRGGASFRPIHDLTLHSEATRMAQALLIISRLGCPERYILQLKTDSILYDPPIKKAEAIQKRLREIQYKDLPNLYDELSDINRYVPQCAISPSESQNNVFRILDRGRQGQTTLQQIHSNYICRCTCARRQLAATQSH